MIHKFRVIWGCQPDAVHREGEPYNPEKYRQMIVDFNLPETVDLEISREHEYDAGEIIEILETTFSWKVMGIRFLRLVKEDN